jgi:hypothetical protein
MTGISRRYHDARPAASAPAIVMAMPTAIVGCASRTAFAGRRSIGKTTFVSTERFATTDDTPFPIASAVAR